MSGARRAGLHPLSFRQEETAAAPQEPAPDPDKLSTDPDKLSTDPDRPSTDPDRPSTDAPPNVDARLRQILDQYGPWLRRTVDRLCPTGMGIDPLEVEQQTLIRLWRALEREKDLSRPASYLYRIVSSVTVDAVRAVRRRSESSLELKIAEQEQSETVELPSTEPASDHRLLARDTEAAISRALGRLSANRRRAAMLHLDGFNNREVATLLGWTEAKVRNLVWRGLHDLRAELRKEGYEP